MTSSSTSSFQTIIESVETLSEEEQDLLFELIHKRRIAKRRQEIAQNASKTLAAVDAGTAKRGSVADLMMEQFDIGTGDYTRDRYQWLDALTLDDIWADLKQQQVPKE